MNRGIYSSGLMSQGEAIEEAKKKRIERLETENKENEKFKHILEIKRDIKYMKGDIEVIKSDLKIILSFIQDKKDKEKNPHTCEEVNNSWWFS